MARLSKTPWPGFENKTGEDFKDRFARQGKLLEQIKRDYTVWQTPVADGYAMYAVVKERPLTLRYIPYGDARKAAPATIRGLTLADVDHQRRAEEAFNSMEKEAEAFYESLKPGQTVHYHHGFDEWIRCEVVVVREGEKELLPKALVGEWSARDLPRRLSNGTVRWGYQAEKIREGKTMRPHATSLWENPKHANRARLKDPTRLPEVDMSVPEMSAKEREQMPLWRTVDAIRAAVSVPQNGDPMEVLARVEELVKAAQMRR